MNTISSIRFGLSTLAVAATVAWMSLMQGPQLHGASVAAGDSFTTVVKADGSLWSWGSNDAGQLGNGSTGGFETIPGPVGEEEWTDVAAGGAHVAAVHSDGSLWTWGEFDQLGRSGEVSEPGRVGSDNDWKAVAAGANHTLALKTDGTLWAWGDNSWGQLGNGSQQERSDPVRIGDSSDWDSIAAGAEHSIAIDTDGTLYTWGRNQEGQLGINSGDFFRASPVKIGSGTWQSASGGAWHTLGVSSNGTLWAWGSNLDGQLGTGSNMGLERGPTRVGSANDWASVAAGSFHSLGVRTDGLLYGWGRNGSGQLGDGSGMERRTPERVGSATHWEVVAAGDQFSSALTKHGVLWATGENDAGQLGDGSTYSTSTFSPSYLGLPDLSVELFIPNAIEPGETESVDMNVFIRNDGSGPVAEEFQVEFRLSPSQEWDHEDAVSLSSITISEVIEAGETLNLTQTIDLPNSLAAGSYIVGAYVDPDEDIVETDTENNIFWTDDPVDFLPDLQVDAFTVNETLSRGDSLSRTLTIRNDGIGDLPPDSSIVLDVRLAAERDWGGAQELEERVIMTGLAGNTSQAVMLDLAIPEHAPIGDYYLGAWIDPEDEIEEVGDADNLSWSSSAGLVIVGDSLEDALGQPQAGVEWTTGGDGEWFARDDVSEVDSPPLDAGEESWFQTSVEGPVLVSFDWETDSKSQDNYLAFSVDGSENARIFGAVQQDAGPFLVPGASQLRWTYLKQDSTEGDFARVSGITIEDVEGPDIAMTSIDYEPGDYVLRRDSITITAQGKNQGVEIPSLPEDYGISVRLSKNRDWEDEPKDSILLGELEKLQGLGANNQFVYQATFHLPDNIPPGTYHIGAFAEFVDEEIDRPEDGNPNGTNNLLWTDSSDVVIVHRPDLQVRNLEYEPGIYTIRGEDGEKPDEVRLSLDLANEGLADVPAEPYSIRVVLSPDRDLDSGDESVLIEFDLSEGDAGLAAGSSRSIDVVTSIPEDATTGDFQYVGVIVDAENQVAESRENNNVTISDHRDIFVQNLTLEAALQMSQVNWATGDSLDTPPWYGQEEIFFSNEGPRGAARPAKNLDRGDAAHMETTVTVEGPTVVSFFWKADSEQAFDPITGELLAENYLAFYIDGQERALISGDVDWRSEAFHLPAAGTYSLRWSYVKEIGGSGGADTGWVDQVSYTSPDLVISFDPEEGDYEPGVYSAGDIFEYTVTIRNEGELSVPLTPSYFVQLRLTPGTDSAGNLDWTRSNANDVILDTFELTDSQARALAPGEELPVTRTVNIPQGLSGDNHYFLGAWVDYTGRIAEGKPLNNLHWSDDKDIELRADVSLTEALGHDPTELHADNEWELGGSAAWSGQESTFDDSISENMSAAQSPVIGTNEEASFQTEVQGPGVMEFKWKVSSREGFNFLRFYLSGRRERQITGEVDEWQTERVFIPAGPQTIKWVYVKNSEASTEDQDTGWVDAIEWEDVDLPDLLITGVDYDPGSYVLQRDPLTLTITAENQGADLPDDIDWEVSDLQVRLSPNSEFGDGDDHILGNFARVETFDSGARLVFSGDLDLPLDLEAGNYYLMARVDPYAEVEEFVLDEEEDNNLWIASDNDVQIRRLPRLVSDLVSFDFEKVYFPYTPIDVDWILRNEGLGDVTGETPYVQEIHLMALERDDMEADPIFISNLSVFSEDSFLPGVSDFHSPGDAGTREIPIYSRMTLPSPATILASLGEVDPGLEEGHMDVVKAWPEIEEYVYYIAIITDAEIAIEQSSDLRISHYEGAWFDINAPFGDDGLHRMGPKDYGEWLELYGFDANDSTAEPESSPFGDGVSNRMKYALNLNPLVPHPGGSNIFESFGRTEVEGSDYLQITFDIVKQNADLCYVVEGGPTPGDMEPLVQITPPFGYEHGDESLSGVDSLKTHPLVLAASDQGYTARVTVGVPLEEDASFLRLVVHEDCP